MKPLSEVAPGLLFIQIQIQAVCVIRQMLNCCKLVRFVIYCAAYGLKAFSVLFGSKYHVQTKLFMFESSREYIWFMMQITELL